MGAFCWLVFFLSLGIGASSSACLIVDPPPAPVVPVEAVTGVSVVSEVEADWRGLAGYSVRFEIQDTLKLTVRELDIPRTAEEFSTLDTQIRQKFPLSVPGSLVLPETFSIDSLNDYISVFMTTDTLRTSQLFEDFATINYKDCFEVKWFKDMTTLPTVFEARLPTFWPVPPKLQSREEVYLEDETPFECWLYVNSWHSHQNRTFFQPIIDAYTQLMPDFDTGYPADNSDVWAPEATEEVEYPYHWFKTPVHFLPGGFSNSRNVRLSYLGKNKFSFLEKNNLDAWIGKLSTIYGSPKRILDVGTGQCFSAFAFERAYPDAEVIGVDLSAGQIRFCRLWAKYIGSKVSFYWANGEKLPFTSDSFDLVQYTYVLHEMPRDNAFRVATEMYRVLKPGGVLSGFEVPYFTFGTTRDFLTNIFTWGYDWNSSGFNQGPEPYFGEYEDFDLYQQLQNAGEEEVVHCQTVFDAVVTVIKPLTATVV